MNAKSIFGKDVFFSDLAVARVPVKKNRNKRIQKKFIKRYGYKIVPGAIMTHSAIFIHPELKYGFLKALRLGKPEQPK